MSCHCQNLPDAFFLDEAPSGFFKRLKHLETGDWIRLVECPDCGTLWAVDEWDKYVHQAVARVTARKGWQDALSEKTRKDLLRRSRGGEENEECMWAGCHKPRIKGVVYCLDHLFQSGARR